MKRFLLLVSAFLSMAFANADTYPYLAFQKNDGTTVSVGVESLSMTFSGGRLSVSNGTETYELTVADLNKMYFSTEKISGVSDVIAGDDGALQVFTLTGINLGLYENAEALYNSVQPGIYIVKTDSKTQKLVVR